MNFHGVPSGKTGHARAELVEPAAYPCFNGSQRQLQLGGKLGVAHVADVGEVDHFPLLVLEATQALIQCPRLLAGE